MAFGGIEKSVWVAGRVGVSRDVSHMGARDRETGLAALLLLSSALSSKVCDHLQGV